MEYIVKEVTIKVYTTEESYLGMLEALNNKDCCLQVGHEALQKVTWPVENHKVM